jgi:hypothetical protein
MDFGDGDPPDDLAEKFRFDDLTTGAGGKSHSFVLTSIFPLTSLSHGDIHVTVTHFHYRFTFSIGSSGTYCFLPLARILGNVAYYTSGPHPGGISFMVTSGIVVDGQALDAQHTFHHIPINNNQVRPVNLTLHDFAMDEPGYRPSKANLSSQDGEAQIEVWIQVAFHNGWPSYYDNNPDGQFILDCATHGGILGCNWVKWGGQPTQPS